jgi:hypothetical protein
MGKGQSSLTADCADGHGWGKCNDGGTKLMAGRRQRHARRVRSPNPSAFAFHASAVLARLGNTEKLTVMFSVEVADQKLDAVLF